MYITDAYTKCIYIYVANIHEFSLGFSTSQQMRARSLPANRCVYMCTHDCSQYRCPISCVHACFSISMHAHAWAWTWTSCFHLCVHMCTCVHEVMERTIAPVHMHMWAPCGRAVLRAGCSRLSKLSKQNSSLFVDDCTDVYIPLLSIFSLVHASIDCIAELVVKVMFMFVYPGMLVH
jgi:hypothetical protein